MCSISGTFGPSFAKDLSPHAFNSLIDALIGGLEDYTVDERGDVGSWIRVTCISGLTTVAHTLVSFSKVIEDYEAYLPPQKYHMAVSGILRQGLERLDNVRHEAGECIVRLLGLPRPDVPDPERWDLPSAPLLRQLFVT